MAIRLHRLAWAEKTALRLIKQYGAPSIIKVSVPGMEIIPGRREPSRQIQLDVQALSLSDITGIQIPADVKFDRVVLVASSTMRVLGNTVPPANLLLGASIQLSAEEYKLEESPAWLIKSVQQVVPNGNSILHRLFLGK